jgi:hypothetical protein
VWYYVNEVKIVFVGTVAPFVAEVLDRGLQVIIDNTEPVIDGKQGELVEKLYQANATDYEGIDDVRVDPEGKQHVTSIKTMSKGYVAFDNSEKRAPAGLLKEIEQNADAIAGNRSFAIRDDKKQLYPNWESQTIQSNNIKTRTLVVVIPENHGSYLRDSGFVQSVHNIATRVKGVSIRITTLGRWRK